MNDRSDGLVREQVLGPGLLRWTLDHPRKRNAVTPQMLAWLERRAGELRGEVVIITGEGDTSFCAGFDLDALPQQDSGALALAPDAPLFTASDALRRADATLVAVLHGHVYGAGVQLACSCDLRVARFDARFVIPAARLGVVYHAEGIALLERCFGLALTQRLLLLGETISADEALRAGAIHGVHSAADLEGAVMAIADKLRAGAPQSLRAHRDRLRALAAGLPFTSADARSYDDARRAAYLSEDHREGRLATRERRPPRFTGG